MRAFDVALRPHELAGVHGDHPHHGAGGGDDAERADDRHPPERLDAALLLVELGRDGLLGIRHHRSQNGASLVHRVAPSIGRNDGERFVGLAGLDERDGSVELVELGVDDSAEFAGKRRLPDVAFHELAELGDLQANFRACIVIGGEIGVGSRQEIAPLAGFGVLQQAAQVDDRRALLARREKLLGGGLRAADEPERRADNAQQRRQSDEDGERGGPDEGILG